MINANPRHLLHIFPTFAVGGSQIRFGQLVKLHGERYRHSVIALDGVTTMTTRIPKNAQIVYLPPPPPPASFFGGLRTIQRFLAEIKPDALVTYNWGSFDWWLVKRFNPTLPHIHIEDGFGPEERTNQLPRRMLARRLVLNDKNTQIILPSKLLHNIAHQKWFLPKTRLNYIPNSVNWGRFNALRNQSPEGRVIIGTVAALRAEKNISRLIRLFNEVALRRPKHEILLRIVGDGPVYGDLVRLASLSPFRDRITFTGASLEPEKHLAEMDIFALTSDTEQMPLAVLEAMASPLPIVSFNAGDVAQMVADTNLEGANISHNDDEGYITQLLRFIDDRQLRNSVAEDNLAKVKAIFDEDIMANAYAELFG